MRFSTNIFTGGGSFSACCLAACEQRVACFQVLQHGLTLIFRLVLDVLQDGVKVGDHMPTSSVCVVVQLEVQTLGTCCGSI
jgi:hypothetical protein